MHLLYFFGAEEGVSFVWVDVKPPTSAAEDVFKFHILLSCELPCVVAPQELRESCNGQLNPIKLGCS